MICLNCKSDNLDGKAFCADCGTPLLASARYLEQKVMERTDQIIAAKFKDQRLLVTETSNEIREKLVAQGRAFAWVVGIPSGLLILTLGVLGISSLTDFKGYVRKAKENVKSESDAAYKKALEATGVADKALKKATEGTQEIESARGEIQNDVQNAHKIISQVKTLSDQVSNQQKENAAKFQADRAIQAMSFEHLRDEMRFEIDDIRSQRGMLERANSTFTKFFDRGSEESFELRNQTPKALLVLKEKKEKTAYVFVVLKAAPIYQTVGIEWSERPQPTCTYANINNVLIISWTRIIHWNELEDIGRYVLKVKYSPDPTVTKPPFTSLSLKNGQVYADDGAQLSHFDEP
jgi:hypothetical protein